MLKTSSWLLQFPAYKRIIPSTPHRPSHTPRSPSHFPSLCHLSKRKWRKGPTPITSNYAYYCSQCRCPAVVKSTTSLKSLSDKIKSFPCMPENMTVTVVNIERRTTLGVCALYLILLEGTKGGCFFKSRDSTLKLSRWHWSELAISSEDEVFGY